MLNQNLELAHSNRKKNKLLNIIYFFYVDWLHEQENLTKLFSRLPIKRGLDQLLTDQEILRNILNQIIPEKQIRILPVT
jgi:hypothetical protein